MDKNLKAPLPIISKKETQALDDLTKRYNKLVEPSMIAKCGSKAVQHIPKKITKFGNEISSNISEQELYIQMMNVIANGFKIIEEQAAKFSVSENQILKRINKTSNYDIKQLDEICLVRSYDLAKAVSSYKTKDIVMALIEGFGTGMFGFGGLPFNLVLSTFLYFRAVQSIAMFYGYDVKNDSAELVIASEVFTNALSPMKKDIGNGTTDLIGKFMLMGKMDVVKQTAKKTWTDMAAQGGIPLLLTQIRALAHKSAKKALENVGAKGLENSLFREAFEQIGRRLTLKTIGKAVPIVSGAIGGMIDTAQMKEVLEYADIFYQKRFILEKESRIYNLIAE